MNYEEKYKDALKKAKSMIDDLRKGEDILAASDLESMFPELKESEEEIVEKIRKDIISYLNNRQITSIAESSATERWIAWLEKRDKKSDYNPYKATIESISAMVEKYANGDLKDFYDNIKVKCKDAVEYDNTWLEKKNEQKWTEEDECYMGECISAVATKDGWSFEEKRKTKHWLNSLKQRMEQ